jgi:2-polyprenyl-3-methyl-5-hydroxy-6-metoxy-1,4-benzoquinol methylase
MDVSAEPWPEEWLGAFDVIAFCDVLEHLVDPWAVVAGVRPQLSKDGVVVASTPNIRQIRLVAKLLLGKWHYDPVSGSTLQRAHVRFFARNTVADKFREAGYASPDFHFPRNTWHLRKPERALNAITHGRLADLLYGSWTVSAAPRSRSRPLHN